MLCLPSVKAPVNMCRYTSAGLFSDYIWMEGGIVNAKVEFKGYLKMKQKGSLGCPLLSVLVLLPSRPPVSFSPACVFHKRARRDECGTLRRLCFSQQQLLISSFGICIQFIWELPENLVALCKVFWRSALCSYRSEQRILWNYFAFPKRNFEFSCRAESGVDQNEGLWSGKSIKYAVRTIF